MFKKLSLFQPSKRWQINHLRKQSVPCKKNHENILEQGDGLPRVIPQLFLVFRGTAHIYHIRLFKIVNNLCKLLEDQNVWHWRNAKVTSSHLLYNFS